MDDLFVAGTAPGEPFKLLPVMFGLWSGERERNETLIGIIIPVLKLAGRKPNRLAGGVTVCV